MKHVLMDKEMPADEPKYVGPVLTATPIDRASRTIDQIADIILLTEKALLGGGNRACATVGYKAIREAMIDGGFLQPKNVQR